jgi:hypothetical protein
MEAARSFETLVTYRNTTRGDNPEDFDLIFLTFLRDEIILRLEENPCGFPV